MTNTYLTTTINAIEQLTLRFGNLAKTCIICAKAMIETLGRMAIVYYETSSKKYATHFRRIYHLARHGSTKRIRDKNLKRLRCLMMRFFTTIQLQNNGSKE